MCGVEIIHDPDAATEAKKIQVRPDAKDPFSKGSMCPKAPVLGPLHFDPSRLRHPVKKTANGWAEISWDEAYEAVERGLKSVRERYGQNAIASYLGNPIVHNLGMLLFVKTLTGAIGSRNIFSATSMDQLPHHFAAHYMFGHEFRIPVPDVDRTDYMILMGANPLASNGSIMTSAGITERLQEIKKRGGKFVVVDPRKTETAKIASEHCFIKPGTDVFFLLAFLHIIFRDKRVKLGRLGTHITGFESLEPLVDMFTPKAVALVIGMEAQTLERLAKEFLAQDRAVLYGRMGLSTQMHGGLCHWLINCINIVSGNFDTPGGMMFPEPAIELVRAKTQPNAAKRWHSRARGLAEFYGELPVSGMADEMLTKGEGQVRAFMTICGNPVLSSPSGNRLEPALEKLDFMVSIDNYINETTRHADIILPTPTGLEVDHYDLIFNTISVTNNAKFSEALFPVSAGRPYDWQVLKELTRRLSAKGLSLFDRLATPRRLVNWGLMLGAYGRLSHPKRWLSGLSLRKVLKSGHGINLGPLRPRVPTGLITPEKKIHMAPPVFLARLQEVREKEFADLAKAIKPNVDEFTLIGRRNVNTNNSWMHQFEKLSRSKLVRCTVMINPDDADRLLIGDGDDVAVSSRTGKIVLPAEITDTMMPGAVSIPHGFGHTRPGTRLPIAEAKPGVSVNDITDHLRVDPLTGNAAFSGTMVSIKALKARAKDEKITGKPLTIIYGTRTGNAEFLAQDAVKQARQHGMLGNAVAMDDLDIDALAALERVLVICSTYGEGDMPDNAQGLWDAITAPSAPALANGFYAVLALGDRSYETFCQAGRDWDRQLEKMGAERVVDRVDCDVDYTDAAAQWLEDVLPIIGLKGDQSTMITIDPRAETTASKYSRTNPMRAKLTARQVLTKPGSSKLTYHYAISHPGLSQHYKIGDIVNVLTKNRAQLVDDLLAFMGADNHASLRQRLTEEFEIRTPSSALIDKTIKIGDDAELRRNLGLGDADVIRPALARKDVLALLNLCPALAPDIPSLLALLRPLMPRSYSISSSPNVHKDEAHLTVASVRYEDDGRQHHGVGSVYLADMLEIGDVVPCYFVANKAFTLPDDGDCPIIMIGPGTGIAPFRAFLEEFKFRSNKGDSWLFFGDRNAKTDFLYEDEFKAHLSSGALTRLDLAFSRDQKRKIYVQDRMREEGAELFAWLERGAHIFVCGDEKNMAKDVDRALHDIIEKHGKLSTSAAREYTAALKQQKRYLRDVY